MPSTENDIPAFAFREEPDGTITWGCSWAPDNYSGPEPVVVEYEQAKNGMWVPRQVWTRSPSSLNMHDFDWIESRQELYHHESGGGIPYVNGWSEPEHLGRRIWIADGTVVTSDGWGSAELVLSDDDLIALGIRRVHGPTPAPFADAIEGDVFWCEVCEDYFPNEEGEGVGDCCLCTCQHHMHDGDLVVVADEDRAGLDAAGVYRPTSKRFYTPGLLGTGRFHARALVRVADLPDDLRMDGYAAGVLCSDCAAQVLADRGLKGLGSEWSEDPEAMPDARREALLDAVRSRVDDWIAGCPENRAARVHEWFAPKRAPRFGLPLNEMRMLCEEAGYPA